MVFSLKKIAEEAENKQAYLRGVACYNAGQVFDVKSARDDYYEQLLTARIEKADRSGFFEAEVGFDPQGKAAYYHCSCPSFRRQNGACRHLVALMVHKYYADMLAGGSRPASPIVRRDGSRVSDEAARRLIARYREVPLPAADAGESDREVALLPVLELGRRTGELSFLIGRQRRYVLKDIEAFCEAMLAQASVSYGQKLTVVHRMDCFAPASRPLLALLMEKYADLCAGRRLTGERSRWGRELPLYPSDMERLFPLLGRQEAFCRETSRLLPLTTKEGDPPLRLTVEPENVERGIRFRGEPLSCFSGGGRLYVCKEGVLYRCGEAFSSQMPALLDALRGSREGLFVAEKDLPAFCGEVLPAVLPHLTLTGEAGRLTTLMPQTVSFALYLDLPDRNRIVCRPVCRYETFSCGLYDPPVPGQNRNRRREAQLQAALEAWFAPGGREDERLLEGDDGVIYRFLTDGLPRLEPLAAVYATDALRQSRTPTPPRLTVEARGGEWLELDLDLEGVDPAELMGVLRSYRQRKRYHRLKSGRFLSLTDPAMAGLSRIAQLLAPGQMPQNGHLQLPAYRALFLDAALRSDAAVTYRSDAWIEELAGRVERFQTARLAVPAALEPILRGYQREGFFWLKTLKEYGLGGILADDMGLGKTVQLLALLLDAREDRPDRPSLVVCPTSLILNWESEAQKFTPSLAVRPIYGPAVQRAEKIASLRAGDLAITSYDLLKRDVALYREKPFDFVILDEAQYIKNYTTQNAQAVKALCCRHRFALSGTPVENRLSELWSLFDFLMPGFLLSYPQFRQRFEQPIARDGDETALEALNQMIAPFLLRRMKKDVLGELPDKTETVRVFSMTEPQRLLYLANLAAARQRLEKDAGNGPSKWLILSALMRLRQICCDPSLCYEGYTGGSAKLEGCLELIREAVGAGHKVLLFSQFTSLLVTLEARLQAENLRFYTLQGSTPKDKRTQMADAFNGDNTPVFLISLKAGGTGLNLTGADVVIHFDPWWNVAAQNQATDRAHRIGQKNKVQVYKLIVKDSIEEKILRLQESKQELAGAVIRQRHGAIGEMTPQQLLALFDMPVEG